MKSWLKFFGLSFFSDKIVKEARVRGVLNCVLGFVFALIFIFCGVLAANAVPFYTHYENASGFKAFVRETLEDTRLTVKDQRISADEVVNTYLNGSDAEAGNGYNLVIDTRPASAYDDFSAYCLSKDGKTEIAYEDYLALSDERKEEYDFKIRYTPDELILTDELVSGYEKYLAASENSDAAKRYKELCEKKADLSAEEYNHGIYALYIRAYYPDVTAYERAGEVPLLRSYYYRTYLNSSATKNSLFIFEDVLFGFFKTDGGVEISFYGSYGKVSDGALTADGADGFIKDAFSSSVKVSANVYLMNVIKFIPLIVFIPLILALILKLALSLMKDEKYKKVTTCLKMECSFVAAGALLTALIMFVCGFFISNSVLNILPLVIFALVLAARTAVFSIHEYFILKNPPEQTAD